VRLAPHLTARARREFRTHRKFVVLMKLYGKYQHLTNKRKALAARIEAIVQA
jgi:hypothetical protein